MPGEIFLALRILQLKKIEGFKLEDLKNPPGNYLEHLKGRRKGQMSIRISQQWRLCFCWKKDGAYYVEPKL